ncbi:hypothetical protein BKA61DRAFT_692904 [Leptodontidium sp. MPI-SDFR-AT-0119]|nr:hypothetical protein BKA61DRAFT_692904 [Leptodontidium sp. MPI-SDFR-AT-0119]
MAPKAASAAENLETALDCSNVPPFWKRKNGLLLYFILTSSFFFSLASGFDGQDEFGHPTGSTLGFFGISTGIGGVIPLVFLNWLLEYLGRKWPTVIGAVIIIGSSIMQNFSTSLIMFIGAKRVLGFRTSIVQMGVPERAVVTSLYNTSVVLGCVIGDRWAMAMRLPTLYGRTSIPPKFLTRKLTFIQIHFNPESPRWLVALAAPTKLSKFSSSVMARKIPTPPWFTEFDEIKAAIALDSEKNFTWKQFFASAPNLKRIAICTAVAVFSQSMGSLLSYFISIICCFLMNTLRRRTFFLWGSGGTPITFIVWTVGAQQFTENGNIAASWLVIACIFFFQLFYVIAWQVLVKRAKMRSNYVNPIGLESIGWKYYIYLCVWIAMIWGIVCFCFPETMGPTLEELEAIFDDPKERSQRDVEKVRNEKEEVENFEEAGELCQERAVQ